MRFIAILGLMVTFAGTASARRELSEAELHYREGGKLYRARKFDAAVGEYEKAIALGGEAETLYDLGQAHRMAGHLEQALMCFRLYARLSPQSPLRFVVKGQVVWLTTRYRRAERARRAAEAAAQAAGAPGSEEPATDGAASTTATAAATANPTAATAGADPAAANAAAAASATDKPPGADSAATATATTAGETPASATAERPNPRTEVASAAQTPARRAHPEEETKALRSDETQPIAALAPAPPGGLSDAEIVGSVLVIGGAGLLGGGLGFAVWAHEKATQLNQGVRFDPAAESGGHAYAATAAVLSIAGAAAILVGGEIIRRHHQRVIEGGSPARAAVHLRGFGIAF